MSKLTELLDELCPDGVEYRVLGDLTELSIGKFVKKTKQRDDFEYPVYNGGAEPTGYFSEWNAEADSIVIAARGSIGFVNFVTTKFWAGNSSYVLKNLGESIDRRYLYHYLKHHEHDLYKLRSAGSIPAINKKPLSQMLIGIPPLEVQQEIVRVLDAFTDLEQSLVSELELRKKQFEEYLSGVLQTSNSGWKSATLGDIGSVRMCKRIMKHQTSPVGDVPFFKIGSFGGHPDAYIPRELFEEYRSKYSFPKVGEILISAAGTIGRTVKYDGEAAYFQDSNIVWLENDETEVTNDYLYYWYKVINWTTDSGTIKRLYNKNLLAAGISYPNKAGQEEIVAKLNTFESLIQSIEQEINLRRTQYEFYRDELLSFPPKED